MPALAGSEVGDVMLLGDWIGPQGSRFEVLEPQVRGRLSLRGQRQQALRRRLRGVESALGGDLPSGD